MKRFVTILVVFALVLVAAACGGDGGGGGEQELADELHVYNWSEYIDPEIYADFEDEFGVKVIEDTFASNEDLLAKLQAGATGYDLIIPSDYMVTIMAELDPQAELVLNLSCPACGHAFSVLMHFLVRSVASHTAGARCPSPR